MGNTLLDRTGWSGVTYGGIMDRRASELYNCRVAMSSILGYYVNFMIVRNGMKS